MIRLSMTSEDRPRIPPPSAWGQVTARSIGGQCRSSPKTSTLKPSSFVLDVAIRDENVLQVRCYVVHGQKS